MILAALLDSGALPPIVLDWAASVKVLPQQWISLTASAAHKDGDKDARMRLDIDPKTAELVHGGIKGKGKIAKEARKMSPAALAKLLETSLDATQHAHVTAALEKHLFQHLQPCLLPLCPLSTS